MLTAGAVLGLGAGTADAIPPGIPSPATAESELAALTGASSWTTAEREAFANDLSSPQLWTVTDNVNQSKSDQTPDQWKPPLQSEWCRYARAYTHVKYTYDLTVNDAEEGALEEMLATC